MDRHFAFSIDQRFALGEPEAPERSGQKIALHNELADLRLQLVDTPLGIFSSGITVLEHLAGALKELFAPLRDLVDVDAVPRGQLGERGIALQSFQCDSGLKLRGMVPACTLHGALLLKIGIAAATIEQFIHLSSRILLSEKTSFVKETDMSQSTARPKLSEKGLLTPDNCVVAIIDLQPQMLFGVANFDRQTIINNNLVLTKAAQSV